LTETLGLYVQIPFCASKCSYCNFSSRVARAEVFDSYCRAVELEIERLPDLYNAQEIGQRLLGFAVDTVYVGGGTPTIVGAERLARILGAARERFHLDGPPEFTLEVTPASADENFLKEARGWGVNRLSIGAQSFSDRELRAVGRLHSAADTYETVASARRAGFSNISLDLIAGLPGQTQSSWQESLRVAQRLQPEHVSAYIFEVDEKSRLGKEVLRHGERYHATEVPDEDFMVDAYECARNFLRNAGYRQYEISNFALPGFESRHNQRYWRLEPYFGLGAGAHSFDGEWRWANETPPEAYVQRLARGEAPLAETRRLTVEELGEEFFFLGLRQAEGVDLSEARQRWGEPALARWMSVIEELAERSLLVRENDKVRLAEHTVLVSNEVFQEFLVTGMEAQ
jgi:oxygen-independent coproporphyrinogen-3 oxidase